MTGPLFPWVQGAVLELLRADVDFMTACGGRVDSEAPDDVSQPYAVVWPPGVVFDDDAGVSSRPMIQVSGWGPKLPDRDVKGVVWMIASHAARVLGSVEVHRWQNYGFGTRVIDIAPHLPDRDRSDSAVLFGAYTRVELSGQAF